MSTQQNIQMPYYKVVGLKFMLVASATPMNLIFFKEWKPVGIGVQDTITDVTHVFKELMARLFLPLFNSKQLLQMSVVKCKYQRTEVVWGLGHRHVSFVSKALKTSFVRATGSQPVTSPVAFWAGEWRRGPEPAVRKGTCAGEGGGDCHGKARD